MMEMGRLHQPVMLPQIIDALSPSDGDHIIDATFGNGGYSRAILNEADCFVAGIDKDPDAVLRANIQMQEFGNKFKILEGSFSTIEALSANTRFSSPNAIVFDLGVCSTQLDQAERGFSFNSDGPLDMRMSKEGETAADVVNSMSEKELADIIYAYGDERASRRIARAINAKREETPFVRTSQLAQIIRSVLPRAKKGQSDPATRTFQALRIYVNNEINELCEALLASERLLGEGGILAVVSFHSLEDRIVKRFFSQRAGFNAQPSRHQPMQAQIQPSFKLLPRKPILPEESEVAENPRSRSAKLRVGVRTSAAAHSNQDALKMMMGRD
jgi:16S rRNA (cytosine1402-N4)-methyltransferase